MKVQVFMVKYINIVNIFPSYEKTTHLKFPIHIIYIL